jgi:cysteine-rich repeat protein
MTVDRKSKILADVSSNANNKITYRDPGKPPVLEGTIEPAPVLSVNPSLVGCPVCGNLEIDRGESCDDGNTTAGDSCSEVCQDEGCIADTPGYPAVDLCDDSDACTLDLCDPVAHQCQNPISCDEGVACTTDACVTGACVNTPVDALCDDSNDCTDDICSAATGCVYAGITGPSCDDGDPCTVTGTCDGGTCVVTDKSYTQRNKINSVLRSGVDNDLLKVRLEMPLTDFTTSPTVTGLLVELFDADDQSVYSATLAASDWEDLRDLGTKFRFRDTQGPGGPANGMSSVKIAQKSNKGVAKFTAKMRGHEIPGAAAQERMTLSLLFGTDPAIDECLTARRVPCSSSTTRTSCKE